MAIQPISWVVKETIQSERDNMFHRTSIVCGGIRAAIAVGIGEDASKQQAKLISDAVNNTAGAGIDPKSVPLMLQACKNALADLAGIMPEHDPNGDRTHPGWTTINELEKAINAAAIKQ